MGCGRNLSTRKDSIVDVRRAKAMLEQLGEEKDKKLTLTIEGTATAHDQSATRERARGAGDCGYESSIDAVMHSTTWETAKWMNDLKETMSSN